MKQQPNLNEILNRKNNFNVGETFDECLTYFKKTFFLNGLVLLIIMSIIMIPIIFLLSKSGIFSIDDPQAFEEIINNNSFFLYNLLAGIFISILTAPIFAGFVQINRDIDTDNEVGISNILKHYKSKYFIQIVGFTLIIQLINFALVYLAQIAGISFVGTLLSYIVTFLSILGIPLIIFSNLNAVKALEYSIKIILKNPTNTLSLYILSILVALLGILACGVGIIFTLPLIYTAQFVLYKKLVGFNDQFEFDMEKNNN